MEIFERIDGSFMAHSSGGWSFVVISCITSLSLNYVARRRRARKWSSHIPLYGRDLRKLIFTTSLLIYLNSRRAGASNWFRRWVQLAEAENIAHSGKFCPRLFLGNSRIKTVSAFISEKQFMEIFMRYIFSFPHKNISPAAWHFDARIYFPRFSG